MTISTRAKLLTAAALTTWIGLAGAAHADRGYAQDNGATAGSLGACTLGSACSGIPLSAATFGAYFIPNRMYVYHEGVVSFGAPLPLTASVHGGTSSLGDGDWFAPSFGPALDVVTYNDIADRYRIDFGVGLVTVPANCTGSCTALATNAAHRQFEFEIPFPFNGEIFFNGHLGDGSGRVEAFHFVHAPPFGPPPAPIVFDPGSHPDEFQLGQYGTYSLNANIGLPEPGAWALMLAGFGAVGAVMRCRRRAAVLPG